MNVQDLTSYAWLGAGVAGVAAFWNQIKIVVQNSFTWFITSSTLDLESSNVVMAYLRKNCREVVLGRRTYGINHLFIRSTKKYGSVAIERSAKGKVFMWGWLPILVTTTSSSGGGNDLPAHVSPVPGSEDSSSSERKLAVTSLRWFFDFEQFFADAVTEFNCSRFWGVKRYHVMRITSASHERGGRVLENQLAYGLPLGLRVIGHDPKDLGEPVPESPFKHLAYSKDVLGAVLRAKDWMESKSWYDERQIPWRLGMQFNGLPGTGKTSCAKALAQELDLPVYTLDLTTMGNDDLVWAWSQARSDSPCMILLEDLDRVTVAKDDVQRPIVSQDSKKGGFSFKPTLTLDCLLNCISGIERSDGILVVATANDASKLDSALTRPGRMDVIVEFTALDQAARLLIARRILPPTELLIAEVVAAGDGETGAQFTKRAADKALELYWADRK